MTKIQCQDKFVSQDDLTDFGEELKANHAMLQTPLNCSNPTTSKVTYITYILILDPVLQFDESKTSKTEIESIMNKYGFNERT